MDLKRFSVKQILHKAIGLNVLYLFKNMHLLSQNTDKMVKLQSTHSYNKETGLSQPEEQVQFYLVRFFFGNHTKHIGRARHMTKEGLFSMPSPIVHVSHSTTISCLPEKLFLKHSACSKGKLPYQEGARRFFSIELSIDTISHNKIQIAGYKGHHTTMIIFFEAVVTMCFALSIRKVQDCMQLTVHNNSQIKYTSILNSH